MFRPQLSIRQKLFGKTLDHLAATLDADAVRDQAGSYTLEEDIQYSFADQQQLAYSGRQELLDKLETHRAESPTLSDGDIDVAWDQANVGKETIGGMAPLHEGTQ